MTDRLKYLESLKYDEEYPFFRGFKKLLKRCTILIM